MDKELKISDYHYDLPQEKIAMRPLESRDKSKLLHYNKGTIEHHEFGSITELIPKNSSLYFNDTKVIPARIFFTKETGASIEIFLLSPITPSSLLAQTMSSTESCDWCCTIGNLKRWNDATILSKKINNVHLQAKLVDRSKGIVHFMWAPSQLTFAEIVTACGVTPLPPYIKREAVKEDLDRYQTVYSHYEGAVAAPTAGLHFTNAILNDLKKIGVKEEFLTLHVSAGTFQPVKTENALEHTMHKEQVVVEKKVLESILDNRTIIPVGTTSMRTLESLYWYGTKLLRQPDEEFHIDQYEPYHSRPNPSKQESIEAILKMLERNGINSFHGDTSIFIYPGYDFKICDALITNFHQPSSTLILLVAALIGEDWRRVYKAALENNYRFLSYGDSSFLIPKKNRD